MDMHRLEVLTNHILVQRNETRSYHLGFESSIFVTEYHNGCVKVGLNKERSLNSLSADMAKTLLGLFARLGNDHRVKAVLIYSMSKKAFCAGGDLKEFHNLNVHDPPGLAYFLRVEYHMDYLIQTFPKPIISFVDGIVMGGGVGLSYNCSLRVVTDKALWAMPENFIGHIPDVGINYHLARLKSYGLWLGLTGQRIRYKDLMYLGIGTHFIHSFALKNLIDEICETENISFNRIENILNKYCMNKEQALNHPEQDSHMNSIILSQKDQIQECFDWSVTEFSEVMRRVQLEASKGNLYFGELETRLKDSMAFSVLTSFEMIHRASTLSFSDSLLMEYRVGSAIGEGSVLDEGLKRLFDKTYTPKSKSYSQITKDEVLSVFAPRSDEQVFKENIQ